MNGVKEAADPHGVQPVLHAGAALQNAAGVVILLHGRGASARDILSLGSAFAPANWALLAPEAAQGTWYPYSFLAPREDNEPWLSSALAKVERVLQSLEEQGFGAQHVVLAGFSQGACLTSEFAANHPQRYAAILALTGGMVGPTISSYPLPGSFDGTPALFSSGDPDPHVPWERVKVTAERFRAAGADVTLRRYSGRAHTVSREELLLAHDLLSRIPARIGPPSRASKADL